MFVDIQFGMLHNIYFCVSEIISTCWMTIVLLAISFVMFYALGMSAYRRHPVIVVRCNETKPASNVFYHSIISQDFVPFSIYSEYLSFMATKYPLLHFHIFFLIDDAWHVPVQSSWQPNLMKRLIPHIAGSINTVFKQNNNREIRNFQRRFQNVNVSVMYLSKYMGMTPLKHGWRMIPARYLTFYARVYEVWQNGGVGFDLVTFNNQYNSNQELDRRIDAILKQHSNGIETKKYATVVNSFDKDEENEIFSMFLEFVNHILNQTSSFLNIETTKNVNFIDDSNGVRAQRNKRNVPATVNYELDYMNNKTSLNNDTSQNILDTSNTTMNNDKINITEKSINITLNSTIDNIKGHDLKIKNATSYMEVPQVLFFYDLSGFSDESGPSYVVQQSVLNSVPEHYNSKKQKLNYLLLSPEGYFVAASSRHHPFLAQLFTSACHRLDPKYAIKNTLLNQCSRFLRDDVYCESIRIIYNVV